VLHTQAERSGIVRQILTGRVSRRGYSLFLRNLLPVYEQMEAELRNLGHVSSFQGLTRPELYRAESIKADLTALCGPAWLDLLPILPASKLYAMRVAAAAGGDGSALLAHVYVRYLGDLNGGRILKDLLVRSLGLEPELLSFYDFPGITDLEGFKIAYRAEIDRSAHRVTDMNSMLEEGVEAFELNIRVSEAVQQALAYDNADPLAEGARPSAMDHA
jgi:heme oxygenase